MNAFQPGKVLSEQQRAQLVERYSADARQIQANAEKGKSISQTIIDMIPENPLQEMVGAVDGSSKGNGMLAVMCCSLIIGLAMALRLDDCRPRCGAARRLHFGGR